MPYRNNKFPILKVTTLSLVLLPIFPMRIQVQKSLPTYLQSLGMTVLVNRTAGQGTEEHQFPKHEQLPRLSLDLSCNLIAKTCNFYPLVLCSF